MKWPPWIPVSVLWRLLLVFFLTEVVSSAPPSSLRQVEATQAAQVVETSCDCQWRFLKHYAVRGCRPVYGQEQKAGGSCHCPVRFQCPQATTDGDATVCLSSGREYRVGEVVETSNYCEICECSLDKTTNRAGLSCAPVECPQAFQPRLQAGCYYVYREGQCCPAGFKCENETDAGSPVCHHDGKEYRLGQKIYPDKDPCLSCLCSANWTGPEGPSCRRHDCQLERELPKLKLGCLPIYHQGTCCPVDFHCPKGNTPELTSSGLAVDNDLPSSCREPAVFGSCHEAFPRFHFNHRQGRCEEFLYSGCGGNANRFATRVDCEDHCGSSRNKVAQQQKPAPDQCVFDRRSYAIGETLDIAHPTHCVTCTCSVPPDFTCIHQSCPPPPGGDYQRCMAEYKAGACCAQYTCPGTEEAPLKDLSGMKCIKMKCEEGCRLDTQVPQGTCPGCICEGAGGGEARSVRAIRCPSVSPDCASRAGCRPSLSQEGCPECLCQEDEGKCFPPDCRCPSDPRCQGQGCYVEPANFTRRGYCPVCRCGQGRSLQSRDPERLQCPSASKCPEGCQLSSSSSGVCPVCRCGVQHQKSAKPCLPPLCLCGPPRCEPGCQLDRRVPLGRCPGCVCDTSASASFERGGSPQQESRPGDSRCKTPHCEAPCRLQERPPHGQCPSCICRFDKDSDGPIPRTSIRVPSERRHRDGGQEECPDLNDCQVPDCRVVSRNGQCPECLCQDKRSTGSCPASSSCDGVGCRAVVGADGCPQCQCRNVSRNPCPDSFIEEQNCRDPCEWQATPRKGCPKCLCPKETGSLIMPRPRQKCLTAESSSCEGTECRLTPDPEGCPVCTCSKSDQDKCGNPSCHAFCSLESPGVGGRCPICVCPPGAYRT